ncbi:hypothetical protein VZT92_025435 [Zoarces viviparus]|uniref:Secreted protein n=1 Tax=Zoarces viviparus TaxID=48416 RepID=A0AAW1DY48_ZOAVI
MKPVKDVRRVKRHPCDSSLHRAVLLMLCALVLRTAANQSSRLVERPSQRTDRGADHRHSNRRTRSIMDTSTDV